MAAPYDLYLHSLADEYQSANGSIVLYSQGDRPLVNPSSFYPIPSAFPTY